MTPIAISAEIILAQESTGHPRNHRDTKDYPVSHQRTCRTAFLEAVKCARIRAIKFIFYLSELIIFQTKWRCVNTVVDAASKMEKIIACSAGVFWVGETLFVFVILL